MGDFEKILKDYYKTKRLLTTGWLLFGRSSLERRLNLLNKSLDYLVAELLNTEDYRFSELQEEAQNLLTSSRIPFKITRMGGHPKQFVTTKVFEGAISKKGYLYLRATQNNPEFNTKLYSSKPFQYEGNIDYLGSTFVQLKHNVAISSLSGVGVLDKFEGSISSSGEISFDMSGSAKDIDQRQFYDFPSKLIADPFTGNEEKRRKYLETRKQLREAIRNWRTANNLF